MGQNLDQAGGSKMAPTKASMSHPEDDTRGEPLLFKGEGLQSTRRSNTH
jgi:hypothetical protein